MHHQIKNIVEKMPYRLGSILSSLPYTKRPGIGSIYSKRLKDYDRVHSATALEQKAFVFDNISKLTQFAFSEIPFYKDFYKSNGFDPKLHLKSFEDIKSIPIIKKSDLQKWDIEDRSTQVDGRYKVNTAGSSGVPLDIYIQPDSMGHEWAHMHRVWSKIGFKYTDLKLTLVGRVVGEEFLKYDAARHSYNLNIYEDYDARKGELFDLMQKRPIKYIHGYPSAIYHLCVFLNKESSHQLKQLFRDKVKGVLMGSEFPPEPWRKVIEETFAAPSVSWYGHTERAVLAYEKREPYTYHPFLSYGYAESVEQGGTHHLVGTAYHNYASPLIRYNTEDVIDTTIDNEGILKSFKISSGRLGEFIKDADGNHITLTGLIYGRHHKLFDVCSHVQVYQETQGKALILYVPIDRSEIVKAKDLFDCRSINVIFDFKSIDKPILTKSGKLKLLVKQLPTSIRR